MALTRKTLFVGALTALEAGCLLGVACLGRGLLPLEEASAGALPPELEERTAAVEVAILETPPVREEPSVERVAIPDEVGDEEASSGGDAARAPRKESEFYASFLELAASEPDAFERIARAALVEEGPDCRKVAALRALCDVRSAVADAALVAAVLDLKEVSSGNSESVPDFALRRLALRATVDAGAQRALEQIVFGPTRPSSRLRATAAAALFSSAAEVDLVRLADRLRGETDELVLGGALAALSRNPSAQTAEEVRASLGLPEPPGGENAEQEE